MELMHGNYYVAKLVLKEVLNFHLLVTQLDMLVL